MSGLQGSSERKGSYRMLAPCDEAIGQCDICGIIEYCSLIVPSGSNSVGIENISGRGQGPEIIEAKALIRDAEYDDARRCKQPCSAVQKSYDIRLVLYNMTGDKCVKGTVILGWHNVYERTVAPNKIHLFDIV